MKIAVCVKRVPDTETRIRVGADGQSIDETGVKFIPNPYDDFAIEEALRKRNKRALAVEGLPHASWVLMDFGDVVVHVFQDDARAAYDIDGLWMDARRVPVPLSEPRA